MAIENAPAHRHGFYSSFVQVGVPLGVVLANTVFLIASTLIEPASFAAWGWRIGFLLSVSLIFVGTPCTAHGYRATKRSGAVAARRRLS